MELSIPPPRTPDGRVYRWSPNEDAHPRLFVLGDVRESPEPTPELQARMKHPPRSPKTVCPYSGIVAPDQEFTHPDDLKAAIEIAKHAALQDVQDAMSEMVAGINRRAPRNSMFRLTAEVKSTRRPKPRFGRRDLMRELVCDHCGRDYGVFAIGLFCPDCGAPNLRLHFAREGELVRDQVELAESLGEEFDELAYRILGNAHEDVLTAFEATLKTVYLYGMAQRPADATQFKAVGNDFQNVERGTKRYEELGFDPFSNLHEPELATLRLNIQKRHIIGHNLGVVDAKFTAHAVDAKVGETVQLVGEDIRTFAAICQKVVDQLDAWLVGSAAPYVGEAGSLVETMPEVAPDDPMGLMDLDLDLSRLAREIAVWVATQDQDGRRGFVDREALRATFSNQAETELVEAVAELGMDDFVQTSTALGEKLPSFRPLIELYSTFDRIALGHDPVTDSVTLAEAALAGSDAVSSDTLLEKLGWSLRRFNPALELVTAHVHHGRVSRINDPQFVVRSFHIMAEDRIALKRYIARTKG